MHVERLTPPLNVHIFFTRLTSKCTASTTSWINIDVTNSAKPHPMVSCSPCKKQNSYLSFSTLTEHFPNNYMQCLSYNFFLNKMLVISS